MQAIWLEDQQLSFRKDIAIPEPISGQALVRVRLAGVCSTDLELLHGYYPFCGVPGHEFVGEVISAPAQDQWVGKRVVGEINLTCGICQACVEGYSTHCELRKVLGIIDWNGAFAEYLLLPVRNLHWVDDNLPDDVVVFTEPLAAALEIMQQVPYSNNSKWLVVGAGRLGQLIAQMLAASGCSLSVVARHPSQRQLLEKHKIAWISEAEVVTGKIDIVVEATGTPQGFSLARRAVRPRGTIVIKSTYRGDLTVNFSKIVVDEITLVGSRCGPFPPALQLLASGAIDPLGMIQGIYPLHEGLKALELAAQPGVLKVLIKPERFEK
jgi:threonine dehydrogenase-like Zn-dependent dehydrogenase